jgi:hypothetical protein
VNLLKRHVLKRCIYGVDKNPMAVELAKVSLWLDCFTLGAPLSFLDHHLKCGNSLIGVWDVEKYITPGSARWGEFMQALSNIVTIAELTDNTSAEVAQSQELYKQVQAVIQPQREQLNVDLAASFVKLGNTAHARRVAYIAPFDRVSAVDAVSLEKFQQAQSEAQARSFFHWKLEFPEVFVDHQRRDWKTDGGGGFDVVVGNPPYIRSQELNASDTSVVSYFRGAYSSASASFDAYLLFVERAKNLMSTAGTVGFIIPNKFFTASYGQPIRSLLSNHVERIIDFTYAQVFEDVAVYTCLLFFRNARVDVVEYAKLTQVEPNHGIKELDFLSIGASKIDEKPWVFVESDIVDILTRIRLISDSLEMLADRIFQGIRTSDNDFYVIEGVQEGGIIVGSSKIESGLSVESSICRQFLAGDDIDQYEPLYTQKYVIVPYQNQATGDDGRIISERELERTYPLAYAYFLRHKQRLEDRERGRMKGQGWYGYIYPKNLEVLGSPKILSRDIIDSTSFTADTVGNYAFATGYGIVLKQTVSVGVDYVLSLLNSRLLDFCLKQLNSLLRGGYIRVFTQYLEPLPLRRIHFTTAPAERAALAQRLIAAYAAGADADLLAEVERRLPRDVGGAFLAFAPGATGHEEQSDVVHDLLAHLAERMLELNHAKRAEQRRFLGWLEGELRIGADREGNSGLDALTGKSRLRGYLGDYQIDRLGSKLETIWIYNMFPDAGLERLLGLVQSLSEKIQSIDRTGFLDASVLGEVVHPRNFNTLRRIRGEDGAVVEEQEQFIELASTEFLQQQLRTLLEGGARDMLQSLPNGMHSGLHRQSSRGIFFYYTAPDAHSQGRQHFWRYYDALNDRILDNRFVIASLITCSQDTPRVIGELDVFAIQEKVIDHILESVKVQAALEAAPTVVDPVQQTLITALTAQLQNPILKRSDVRTAIAELRKPATTSQVRQLKVLYLSFSANKDIVTLLDTIRELYGEVTQPIAETSSPTPHLQRQDLTLICFDHVVA